MDIQEERKVFEAEFSKIKSDIAFWLHTWDEEMQGYNHHVMCWFWYMWQAAKAQAVPEGFVLVPKECSDDMAEIIAITANVCGGIAGDVYDAILNQAMIEAQELSYE